MSLTEMLTTKQIEEIVAAACSAVASAPDRPGQYVFAAKVPWSRLTRLRLALEDAGCPWRNWR